MSEVPEAAVEAALGAKTEDLPETVQYAMIRGLAAMGFAQPTLASWDIIEAAINAALPHLDGYAAGFAAGQEAAAWAVEARAIALGRAECCGHGIGAPPECCADPIYMISNTEAAAEIRALSIAPAQEQPDDSADRLATAYQIVGALADAAGVMDTPEVQAALDYLSGKPEAPRPLPFVAPSAWRPIGGAPADKNVLLGWWRIDYMPGWVIEIDHARSVLPEPNGSRHGRATHWMPLPAPPASEKEAESA